MNSFFQLTPFFQLFYVYGAVYFVYTIYSNLFSKQISLDKSPKDIVKDMTSDPEKIPEKLNSEFENVKPHLKEIPFVLANLTWMIIGIYTEQWKWFVLLLCLTPIEAALAVLFKKIPEKVWSYSFTIFRVITVLFIYHFKFNF